jgi:DNA-binding LacI/PurR family transcriptional regulator
MSIQNSLFNRPIVTSPVVTLVEQVHDILCEEIHAGRWDLGDRLPGVASLVSRSGLSHGVIQRAMEMLREEGYIRQEERRGSFLESLLPDGRKPLGAIGIVMRMEEDDSYQKDHAPYLLQYLNAVIRGVTERNYTTEVIYLHNDDDWSEVDRVGGPFSERVRGIISLFPFLRPEYTQFPPDRIPLIYEFFPYDTDQVRACAPFVGGETVFGIYGLTERVISAGHRRIVFFSDASYFPDTIERAMLGHRMAMERAGLEYHSEAAEQSLSISTGDPEAIRLYLEECSEATAVVCHSPMAAQSLIAMAESMGLRVPEDLSVVGWGSAPMGSDPSKRLTAAEHDIPTIVDIGFDILLDQMRTRCNRYGHVSVKSRIIEGHSLAPPRREKGELAAASAQAHRADTANAVSR